MKKYAFGLGMLVPLLLLAGCHVSGTIGHPAPVHVTFRQATTDSNKYALVVRNESDHRIHCRVENDDRSISHEFTLDAGEEKSFGVLEIGRPFHPRESGTIYVDGYDSYHFTAP